MDEAELGSRVVPARPPDSSALLTLLTEELLGGHERLDPLDEAHLAGIGSPPANSAAPSLRAGVGGVAGQSVLRLVLDQLTQGIPAFVTVMSGNWSARKAVGGDGRGRARCEVGLPETVPGAAQPVEVTVSLPKANPPTAFSGSFTVRHSGERRVEVGLNRALVFGGAPVPEGVGVEVFRVERNEGWVEGGGDSAQQWDLVGAAVLSRPTGDLVRDRARAAWRKQEGLAPHPEAFTRIPLAWDPAAVFGLIPPPTPDVGMRSPVVLAVRETGTPRLTFLHAGEEFELGRSEGPGRVPVRHPKYGIVRSRHVSRRAVRLRLGPDGVFARRAGDRRPEDAPIQLEPQGGAPRELPRAGIMLDRGQLRFGVARRLEAQDPRLRRAQIVLRHRVEMALAPHLVLDELQPEERDGKGAVRHVLGLDFPLCVLSDGPLQGRLRRQAGWCVQPEGDVALDGRPLRHASRAYPLRDGSVLEAGGRRWSFHAMVRGDPSDAWALERLLAGPLSRYERFLRHLTEREW